LQEETSNSLLMINSHNTHTSSSATTSSSSYTAAFTSSNASQMTWASLPNKVIKMRDPWAPVTSSSIHAWHPHQPLAPLAAMEPAAAALKPAAAAAAEPAWPSAEYAAMQQAFNAAALALMPPAPHHAPPCSSSRLISSFKFTWQPQASCGEADDSDITHELPDNDEELRLAMQQQQPAEASLAAHRKLLIDALRAQDDEQLRSLIESDAVQWLKAPGAAAGADTVVAVMRVRNEPVGVVCMLGV
jgi:hypothetical protein